MRKIVRLISTGVIGGIVGLTGFDIVGHPAVVYGDSMQPTLNPETSKGSNDVVLVNKFAVWSSFNNIQRGDVVILKSPTDSNRRLIKRIVGLEGDFVRTRRYRRRNVHLPDGHCWVEGDNRELENAYDSNVFGKVTLGLITGKVACILWPPGRIGLLPKVLPQNRRNLSEEHMGDLDVDDDQF